MPQMPNPPRTEALPHALAVEALQRWLFSCLEAGWDPSCPADTMWSHEDNQAALKHGWMISQPPSSKCLDLFSLRKGVSSAKMMRSIKAGAIIDPLCAKALTTLIGQKLKHPHINFAFDAENHIDPYDR